MEKTKKEQKKVVIRLKAGPKGVPHDVYKVPM